MGRLKVLEAANRRLRAKTKWLALSGQLRIQDEKNRVVAENEKLVADNEYEREQACEWEEWGVAAKKLKLELGEHLDGLEDRLHEVEGTVRWLRDLPTCIRL